MVDLFAAIRLTRWFRAAAYKELPKDAGDALVLRVTRPARYLFGFWITLAGLFAALTFFVGGIEWYIRAISIPAFLAIFTQWPWAVVLDLRGISKRSYVGIRKTIPWSEVTARLTDALLIDSRSSASPDKSSALPPTWYLPPRFTTKCTSTQLSWVRCPLGIR